MSKGLSLPDIFTLERHARNRMLLRVGTTKIGRKSKRYRSREAWG